MGLSTKQQKFVMKNYTFTQTWTLTQQKES